MLHGASQGTSINFSRLLWILPMHFDEIAIFISSSEDAFGVVKDIVVTILLEIRSRRWGVVAPSITIGIDGHPLWIVKTCPPTWWPNVPWLHQHLLALHLHRMIQSFFYVGIVSWPLWTLPRRQFRLSEVAVNGRHFFTGADGRQISPSTKLDWRKNTWEGS